jgi:hypothetical protein
MPDEPRVVGVASRFPEERLKAHFAVVAVEEAPTIEILDRWLGTRRTDLPSQLADFHQVVRNRADPNEPTAIAVKRVESPVRRPPHSYDCRVSLEAVVMLAAEQLGYRFFAYRTRELQARLEVDDPLGLMRRAFAGLEADEDAGAAAAACAALRDLGHEIEF